MEWTKTTITAPCKDIEVVSALLIDLGIYGTEILDPRERSALLSGDSGNWDYIDESLVQSLSCDKDNASIIFYLGIDSDSQNLLEQVKVQLAKQSSKSFLETEIVNDQTWLHEWKKYYHPFRIGRVLIVPEWEKNFECDTTDVVFTIDPGSAFGTGQHITTALCIETVQKRLCHRDTVLDIGCGSGILSIISLLLGAKSVVGVDIDPVAVDVTRKNAALNPVDINSLNVYTGNILTNNDLQAIIKQNDYDIVIANIVADIVIELVPLVITLLKPQGLFIASGIISERLDDVIHSLSAGGLNVLETKTNDGWCCLVATHG